jgi:hypothetical protein
MARKMFGFLQVTGRQCRHGPEEGIEVFLYGIAELLTRRVPEDRIHFQIRSIIKSWLSRTRREKAQTQRENKVLFYGLFPS